MSSREVALLVGVTLAGCRASPDVQLAAAASAAPSATAPLPADHLLQDELPEGSLRAFGLPLPRSFTIVRSFAREVVASGPSEPEPLANFVRRRIEGGTAEVGPSRTVFRQTHARGGEGPLLRVDVTRTSEGAEIVVQDQSPAPVDPGLSEEERWRRAGLKPNGQLLDPKRVF